MSTPTDSPVAIASSNIRRADAMEVTEGGAPESRAFHVGDVVFGDGRLSIIAGPCVVESREHTLRMAEACRAATASCDLDFVFKASFDKANRTSHRSFRGIGFDESLDVLREVRATYGVPCVTDVHDVRQVERVAEVVDMLQIPAFLCRQTDLLVEAARTGLAVNVKKGQFLAPEDARNIVAKLRDAGCERILLTERGTTFGYHNLIVDMRSFAVMRANNVPVVFDVTHSLQQPGALGNATGGQPEFIEPLARAGVAAGADAVFMEVHDDPAHALSDGANALPLERFQPLLESLRRVHRAVAIS